MKNKFSQLRAARDLRALREWLGVSLSQLAQEIPHVKHWQGDHVSRQFVCAVQRGERDLLPPQMTALVALIEAEARDTFQRKDITVAIRHNSPWRIKVLSMCVVCGKSFELQRVNAKRCARCVAKRKR